MSRALVYNHCEVSDSLSKSSYRSSPGSYSVDRTILSGKPRREVFASPSLASGELPRYQHPYLSAQGSPFSPRRQPHVSHRRASLVIHPTVLYRRG